MQRKLCYAVSTKNAPASECEYSPVQIPENFQSESTKNLINLLCFGTHRI